MDEKELKRRLSRENPEFKTVIDLHQQCEQRLLELGEKGYLTDEEEREQKELKKKKLVLKDRMYYWMTQYQKSLR